MVEKYCRKRNRVYNTPDSIPFEEMTEEQLTWCVDCPHMDYCLADCVTVFIDNEGNEVDEPPYLQLDEGYGLIPNKPPENPELN